MTYKFRNPILQAALEELQQQEQNPNAPESTESTEDVQVTDVQVQDVVAELQSQVTALENELLDADLADISQNSEETEEHLEEITAAASALEEYGDMALLAARTGQANKMLNAALAMGIEQQCERVGYPCIVAALEADAPDVTDVKEVSKSLGDRAKQAASKLWETIMAFFKKIKQFCTAFITGVVDMFSPIASQAKELNGKLGPLKDEVTIDNANFIKALGLTQPDAQKDFEDYARFSATAYATISSKSLIDGVAAFASIEDANEGMNVSSNFFGVLSNKLFTVSGGALADEYKLEESMFSPKLIGGKQIAVTYDPMHNNYREMKTQKTAQGRVRVKISVQAVVTVSPETIKGPKVHAARQYLALVAKWPSDVSRLITALGQLEAAVGAATKTVADKSDVGLGNSIAQNLIAIVSQLMTVLAPTVARHNITVARKYMAYVNQALAASTQTKNQGSEVATVA